MKFLNLARVFKREDTEKSRESAKYSPSSERMIREIKGSIFTLLSLFEFIALTSYIPIDSFNLFSGRIDHINNMGGIVGALVSEGFLGTVGIMGYTVILLTIWMAFTSFRGNSIRDNFPKMLGTILGTVLGAISCHLLFSETSPEASLLQGGMLGKTLGTFLQHFFNTTGALLLVGGGFVVTLILTTGVSLVNGVRRMFGETVNEEEEEETVEEVPVVKEAKPTAAAKAKEAVASPEPKAKAKRSRKKKTAATEEPAGATLEFDTTPDAEIEEESKKADASAIKVFQMSDLIPYTGSYDFPSLRLLKSDNGGAKKMSKGEIKETAQKLIEHLLSFQITGEITEASQGPVLTTYEFKPSAGIKLSKIAAIQEDLGIVLGTKELRIIAPIPGKTVVGIEVPRPQIETIPLKDCISDAEFNNKKIRLPIALGKTTAGQAVFGDLAAFPHLLVAGSTGSGKSVFVNSLIMSLIYRLSPQQMRMILIDPKMLELNAFDGLPHLVTNVITDNRIAFNALSWAVWEMDRRYQLMAKTGSKNLDSYNEKVKGSDKLPFIVIVVDELADLMMSGGEAVEIAITRLAQKARAAGINMVIATQRPSTDVVTGLIKANIPSRLCFKVPSGIDSRTVLDTGGAEELIGRGDSLMIQPAVPLRRLHGTFVTEDELKRVVKAAIGGKDHSKNYIDFSGTNSALDD